MRWVAADDPVLRPLMDDLAREYDARYAPVDGVPSSVELTRYPPEVFSAAQDGAFVAVLHDGELVAGGAVKHGVRGPDGRPLAEIKRMWTHPGRRRQGLAGRVLALLEARAAELGYTGLELTTGAAQPEAVALYLRHGWVPDFDPAEPQDPAAYLRFTKPASRAAPDARAGAGAEGAGFRRAGAAPTIRIVRGGALLVLDAAASRLVGEQVSHVRLLYDRDTRRIGLMPTHAGDPDGFALAGAADARVVGVKAFVDRYRIPVGPRLRLEHEGDLLVAAIPDSIPDGFVDSDAE